MPGYTVLGRSQFPLDMLRYDSCYPVDSDSVHQIVESRCKKRRSEQPDATYMVVLHSEKKPTPKRWISFGWEVT